MIFHETKLKGAFTIEIEPIRDNRGFFSRVNCQREFAEYGLTNHFVQSNITFSPEVGTLRGLHYQIAPHKEIKLVRCTRGAVYDIIVDLRPESDTFLGWLATTLTADTHNMLYIPGGFAHGYQTLEKNTEVYYQVGQFYAPEFERGIRWNDPVLNITWPETKSLILSEKDKAWPDFVPEKVDEPT